MTGGFDGAVYGHPTPWDTRFEPISLSSMLEATALEFYGRRTSYAELARQVGRAAALPAVSEALVIGVPDARLGERPKAFVALRTGASATSGELLALVNGHVGKHERAVAVEIRARLPRTAVGKLSRKELVAGERARAAPSPLP